MVRANLPGSGLRHFPGTDRQEELFEKIVLTADRAAIGDIWVQGRKVR